MTTGDVVTRMRALADAPWIARGDAATQAALREGAAECERLQTTLTTTEARLTSALHACGDAARQRVEIRAAMAAAERYEGLFQRMVQPALATLRERDALRAEIDTARALASGAQYREREALAVVAVLRAREDAREATTGDLAALARREAGPVTRRQWRACARCGREHWLADGEAAPLHGWVDPWGAAKTCVAVVTGEGSEGR